MIERARCILRPAMRQDLDKLLEWRNSERIRVNMYTDHLINKEEHAAWFERLEKNRSARTLVFEVDGRPLGVVNISRIDDQNGTCHWGFYIGEPDAPKGSGTAMGALGLDYLFDTLGIRKVIGEAFAFNEASIAFHRRLGFMEEGRFVSHVLKNGNYEDIVSFAIFREGWKARKETLGVFSPEEGDK